MKNTKENIRKMLVDAKSFFYHNKKIDDFLNQQERELFLSKNIIHNGYFYEKKKMRSFYLITIYDFLPFFIGYLISFSKIFSSYGDMQKTGICDAKFYYKCRKDFIIAIILGLFIWCLLLTFFLFVYPYALLGATYTNMVYQKLRMYVNNSQMFLEIYFSDFLTMIFTQQRIWFTLGLFVSFSMLNFDTFVFYFLFAKERKAILQRQVDNIKTFLDNINKVK